MTQGDGILAFAGELQGETVSMVATGPSCALLRQRDLPGVVMGLNQSDQHIKSDFHVYGWPVRGWTNRYGRRLFTFNRDQSDATHMRVPDPANEEVFSLTPDRYVCQAEAPVVGLQILALMEAAEVRVYGLDLSGMRHSGSEIPEHIVDANRLQLRAALDVVRVHRPKMRVLNCSPNDIDFLERD